MKILRIIRNYFCYCGIEKDEYNSLKKELYVSNFVIWRTIHFIILAVFTVLFPLSTFIPFLKPLFPIYLSGFIYACAMIGLFFVLKKDSLAAQLLIYLTISMLLLYTAFITAKSPTLPAASFIVMILITPLFMLDKPYFMAIEITAANLIFLIWMYNVKPLEIWKYDLLNTILFSVVGFFLHVIANSIRIREFVLSKKIRIQKDTDDMTGLMNKGALTAAINEFLAKKEKAPGILLMLDIDHFKSINDTYGHDIGDSVITQFGEFLAKHFTNNEVVGRFGGDEFIVFIKNNHDVEKTKSIARVLIDESSDYIKLPDPDQKVKVSIGIAMYDGKEKNYSELFKKADTALYEAKADRSIGFKVYEQI